MAKVPNAVEILP